MDAGVPFLDPATIAIIRNAAFYAQITRFEQVAAYMTLVYDWLICWDHEADLLSAPGISPAKVAYMVARYWPLLTHPITIWTQVAVTDHILCEKIFQIPLFLTIGNFLGAASVLIVRLYAFSGALISVAVGLTACLLAAIVFMFWVVATQIQLVPEAPACFPEDKRTSITALSGYFLSPFLFDLVATALFVVCIVGVRINVATSSSPVRVFVREGAFYFVAISAVNLTNAIMSFQPRILISGTVVPFSMLLPNILACRLVINLRSAVSDPVHGATAASTGLGFTSAPPRPRSSITLTEVGIPFQRTPTDFGTPRADQKFESLRMKTFASRAEDKTLVRAGKKLDDDEDGTVAPLAIVKKASGGHAKSASQETASSSSTRVHKKSPSQDTGGRARDATIIDAVVVRSGSRSRSQSRGRGGKESVRSPDGWATREHIELVRSPTGRTYL
ncbi:hypothetical protein AURDEDRAFT_112613 [Auricularia subglabra TFB-10046 SS5]|nr:hypothetical protein AURDEDRAFT_112613 [Auricularia subglabra TFB-10046 SS5]